MRLSILALLLLAAPAWAQSSVFVVNQGNFSDGNGSVTALPGGLDGDPAELFEGQLGSILQSATLLGNSLYLLSNTAGRIDIVDATTLERTGQITGPFSSPRYLADANSGVYVSNQVYDGTPSFILPVDLGSGTTGDPIFVEGQPEGLVPVGGLGFDNKRMYVALGSGGPDFGGADSLAVLSLNRAELIGYVDIDCYARSVAQGPGGGVVAFCSDTDEAVLVDPQTDTVTDRVAFGEDIGDPFDVGQAFAYSLEALARRPIPAGPLYVITASGFAVLDAGPTGLEITRRVVIPDADTRPISAIGVEQGRNDRVVLGRPDPDAPFSATGTATVHDATTGALLMTIQAGIYPADIVTLESSFLVANETALEAGVTVRLAGANPTRGRIALEVVLEQQSVVRISVLDVTGRVVRDLEVAVAAGMGRVDLDLDGVSPGTYLARVVLEGETASIPLTVVR
ncbi:DUF5074 domain-containing protein [Rubrivirga sp.]|uniref:DUF5074 domain-containing protein n=1 Tax=Rubrivirga sp. TaxID=1885344 RepID=UPI003C72630A